MEEQKAGGAEEAKRIALDLSQASKEAIEVMLDDADDTEVFEEILNANRERVDIIRLLYDHPNTPDKVRDTAAGHLRLPVRRSTEVAEMKKQEEAKSREVKFETLQIKIQKLGVSERIRLAMRGGKEARSLLLKDPNKEVILSVLDNPRLTDLEVEMIARSRSVPDEVLRAIARNREWMKTYSVLVALVTNPKTPAGVSMGFVSSLKMHDLQLLEKNKNVAEAVRSAAKRLISAQRKNP